MIKDPPNHVIATQDAMSSTSEILHVCRLHVNDIETLIANF
jgi:hypothetical protein